ncbi:MAG TPA: acetylxylan esterase [Terriglobia bacterium]|nr:acetylxylan esterase [Terriglobia bacterium]
MRFIRTISLGICLSTFLAEGVAFSQDLGIPKVDRRAAEIRNLDMPYVFTPFKNAEEWRARAKFLRQQILVSSGLWPMPEKTPLNPQIFGRIEREGYSIEKVFFESYPGFYVTGNLYRPRGKTGPYPGVLSPHGHWAYGRLADSALGSIPARCISMARQGYVVFTYDMVGYNDSRQVNHRLLSQPLTLWGIGSLGLHLWNSIRSVDFLESLPDVDKARLACTGASGGGTQTFLLTAVDDRIKVSAPVNMISHFMQGGDVCENAPNLRLDTNNMEIGALMAPRPLLMVSAAGDWTCDTPRIEFPAIQSIYKLLGAEDKVETVQFIADHNYNRDSREAVYAWFGRWILGKKDASELREQEYEPEQPAKVLVFFGRELPREAKTEQQLIDYLIETWKAQLETIKPKDSVSLMRFKEVMGPAYLHSLAAEYPDANNVVGVSGPDSKAGEALSLVIGRKDRGDRVLARVWLPKGKPGKAATLLIHSGGIEKAEEEGQTMIRALLKQGQQVMSIDAFNTGSARALRNMSDQFFTTYNRTDDANRVQDILTAVAYLKKQSGISTVNLVGFERAGLWVLLARGLAPELGSTVADVVQFDSSDDLSYLKELYIPLIRRAGDFQTALRLASPSRLLIHNTGGRFETARAEEMYRLVNAPDRLRISKQELPLAELTAWLTQK